MQRTTITAIRMDSHSLLNDPKLLSICKLLLPESTNNTVLQEMNNDPATWHYPVLAGVSGPGMHITGVRELTSEEESKVSEYAKVESAARNRFKLFTILQRNYKQWEDYIRSLLVPDGDLKTDEMVELDRLQLNFLSAAKSLLDHFKQHWTQKHRNSPREAAFSDFIKKLEQACWAFAFFQDLRNFTQHCGLPVGNYSRNVNASSVTITVACDADWLVDHYSGWGKSKLTKAHGKLDLISLTRDYFIRLKQDFGNFVASEFAPDLLDAHNFFAGLAKEVIDVKPRAEFHLLTGYTKDGDNFNFQISSPPADLLGSLGVIVRKKSDANAEQGVAPQSTTRSESDSEGGDKPQPESEERSR